MSLELSPEEQELQETIDKITNEIYSQLGISSSLLKEGSATETAINAYKHHMQKKLEEEK
jgi:hypothetical protein